ncbi:MFS transporter [uncultured Corynebacterium sp.]|uniref:MFS transporter n=1 Tax=uncultured Corynebacterium sp. TaxID=159447 RepID=UPI0026350340|nr:MFS transporter [uncultured Corynebacterium sp.]
MSNTPDERSSRSARRIDGTGADARTGRPGTVQGTVHGTGTGANTRASASARTSTSHDARTGTVLSSALLFVAVIAVAVNLRSGISSVGPVLEETLAAFGADASYAGAITAMPGFLFALLGIVAVPLAMRLGLTRTITIGAVLTFVGLAVRPWVGPIWLFVALTGLVVAGIAVANVLLPAWIKRHGGRHIVALMTIYGALLGLSGALGPLTALMFRGDDAWKWALGIWAIPAAVQLAVWAWVMIRIGDDKPRGSRPSASDAGNATTDGATTDATDGTMAPTAPIYRSTTALFLMFFFGLQSMNAYVQMGWLPQIYRDGGASANTGTIALALVGALNVVGGLAMPGIIARTRNLAPFTVVFAVFTAAGYLGLLLADGHAPLLWAFLLGIGGFCFPTAIALIPARSRSPHVTARLSGFVQPVGYLIAGAGPVVVGAVYSATGEWRGILVALIASAVLMGAVGIRAAKSTFIDDELAAALR